ncbi:diguanylate cyclase [Paenibacillus sp. CMAA1364]
MTTDKYKHLVKQRIKDTFDIWEIQPWVEEIEIYRFLHTLKGTAGTIGMVAIEIEANRLLHLFLEEGTRQFEQAEWYDMLKNLVITMPIVYDEIAATHGVDVQPMEHSDYKENRILIIDDDVNLAAYLKTALEKHGYPVNIALTAERGLKLFYDWKPDMILLDINLPDKNGLDVLKIIVEKAHQSHSPIIVISSEDTSERRIYAYRSGAMDFFSKPIDQELLVALINNRFRFKKQWEQSIIIDELTGAYNRKHFNNTINQLISDYERSERVFTIVIMDLDHFKKVNDTHGHLLGDEVLRTFANIIVENKRNEDILCRYGGEEFALLLPNTTNEEGSGLLKRIHEKVSSYVFRAAEKTFQVSFTAGITQSTEDNLYQDQLVKEADQALYIGKQSGRNQTVIFSKQMVSYHNEQKINIIIVDDDRFIREIVVSQLSQWQPNTNVEVSVKGFESGIQFMQSNWFAEQEKYIILLDGIMPQMDGVEVLRRLRDEYPERNIVIAMLTGRTNQTDIIHALQLGADDYIIKPFDISDLLSRVERLAQKILI